MFMAAMHSCSICGLHYRNASDAGECHAWCSTHSSCNLAVARRSEEARRGRLRPS